MEIQVLGERPFLTGNLSNPDEKTGRSSNISGIENGCRVDIGQPFAKQL